MIRVAIVEDIQSTSDKLLTVIRDEAGLHCAGVYSTAEEALRHIPSLKPDVVLVDLKLPGMSGAELIRQLSLLAPRPALLALTIYSDIDLIFGAIRAGADGCLLKRTPSAEIMEAIREVHAGGSPMTPQIARMVLAALRAPAEPSSEPLTAREKEVLGLIERGMRYREIATALGVNYDTVRTHVQNSYRKLHVHSRFEAAQKLKPHLPPSSSSPPRSRGGP